MDQKTKFLGILALILLGLGAITVFQVQEFAQTRLVFCDVGQGDGILITSGAKQVVIDGGPGNKMVDCLSAKMPFWDRQIEMVVLTHPQRDHMEGLIGVLANYQVATIVTTQIPANTAVFRQWQKALTAEGAKVYVPDVGDRLILGPQQGLTLQVLWPDRDQAEKWQENPPADLNETSIVMRLDWLVSCAYLTGDIPKEILEGLIDRACGLLKIAHHGSRTGTSEEVLEKARPKVAVIQVGKNSFGHPHREVLDLLVLKGIKILRNDTDGIIKVESDGRSYRVISDKR